MTTKIKIIKDDITTISVDGIVNAANKWMRGGGGVDGAIHYAAGPELLEECYTHNGCATGDAKITKGYSLPAKHVIHTVGPVYGSEGGKEAELLESCYLTSLKLANQHNLRSLAFPAISTGVYGYPLDEATEIAVDTIKKYIDDNPDHFDEIIFVAYNDDAHIAYNNKFNSDSKPTQVFYRGTLENPIVFPESVIITAENLDLIDFDKVIYCEVTPTGAMGNEGGILIYLLDDKDNLITYETNVSIDEESYNSTSERIDQNKNLFINYYGGMGNYVYVKKDVQLEIDEKYNCFWYHSQDTKLRVDSSVSGVFLQVVAQMTGKDESQAII